MRPRPRRRGARLGRSGRARRLPAAKGKKGKGKKKKEEAARPAALDTREVIFVGNNSDGTADVLLFDPGTEATKRLQVRRGSAQRRPAPKRRPKKKPKKCKRAKKKKPAAKSAKAKGKGEEGQEEGQGHACPPADLRRIARLNIIPDAAARMAEVALNPIDLGYFIAIQQLIGEGNNQYVDDMYSTNDGALPDRLTALLQGRDLARDRHRQDRLALRGGRPAL